jgi:shikimate kinase
MPNPILSMTDSSSPTQNVILIGFMGTGKTSIGRRVAQSLGFDFVDTDEQIIESVGKPIAEIFAEQGEEGFRDLESAVLRSALGGKNQVISTGGGAVLREENRQALAKSGYVIWLNASAEAILNRVSRNQERPLLQTADPLGTIREMLKQREKLYLETADFTIDTDGLSPDETAFGICESARVIFGT